MADLSNFSTLGQSPGSPFGQSPDLARALQKYQLAQQLASGVSKTDATNGVGVLAKILQGGLAGYLGNQAQKEGQDINYGNQTSIAQALAAQKGFTSPDPVMAGPSEQGAALTGQSYSPTNEAVRAPAGTPLMAGSQQGMYDALASNPNTAPMGQQMQLENLKKKQDLDLEIAKALGSRGLLRDQNTGSVSAISGYGQATGAIKQAEAYGQGLGEGTAKIATEPLLQDALIGPAVKKAQALAPVDIAVAGGKAAAEAPYRITAVPPGGSAVSAAAIAGGGGMGMPGIPFGAPASLPAQAAPPAPAGFGALAPPPVQQPQPQNSAPLQGAPPVAAPRIPVQAQPLPAPDQGGALPLPGTAAITRPGVYQDPRPAPNTQPGEIESYLAKRFVQTQEGANSARQQNQTLDRVNQLLDQVNAGKFAGTTLQLKAAAKAAGIDLNALGISDDVAPAQAAQALSNQMALELRNPSGGAGLPGAMSDADRNFLSSMTPTITTTPEGRALMTETQKKINQRSIDTAEFARQYARDHGGRLDLNFEDALAKNFADKPVFTPTDQKSLASVGIMQQARDAISRGAPKDAVIKRLKEQGIDPGNL